MPYSSASVKRAATFMFVISHAKKYDGFHVGGHTQASECHMRCDCYQSYISVELNIDFVLTLA